MDDLRKNQRRRRTEKVKFNKPQRPQIQFSLCPICGKPVKELSSAITERQSDKPAHFDCILKQLEAAEPPKEKEKYCYLGNGVFGVVKEEQSTLGFSIVRKIQYEKNDEIPLWRKEEKERHLK